MPPAPDERNAGQGAATMRRAGGERRGGATGRGTDIAPAPTVEIEGKPRGPQPPEVSAAISEAFLRPRSVADFSWPQAAMMFCPRGVRTGEA